MKQVQVIQATDGTNTNDIIRVGAYCRVSTDSEDQANSFHAQVKYYKDYIRENEQMTLVDIYADEGISGTSINKRDEFKRMMSDSKKGKLDRVLVKSVTRFARNALECIESVRLLKSYGVNVIFENDKIDTEKMTSEMMLYIKSAFAQCESLSHSKRIKTSIKMKMKEGEYCPTFAPYGYKYDKGKLIIVPEEAENVRKIYELYLSGMGMHAVLKYMQEYDKSGMDWKFGRIEYILSNERYIGDYRMKKTFTPEQFPLRNRTNRGQEDMYYLTGANESIISKKDFETVQNIKKNRESKFKIVSKANKSFDYKIKCHKCGWAYRKKSYRDKEYYACSKKGLSLDICHAPSLTEEEIQAGFIKMYNIFKFNSKVLLDDTILQLQLLKSKINNGNSSIAELDTEIATLSETNKTYNDLYTNEVIDKIVYLEKTNSMKKRITELRSRRNKLLQEDNEELCIDKLRELKRKLMNKPGKIVEFDKKLYEDIVDVVYVEQDGSLLFSLIGGLDLLVRRESYEK